MSKPRRLAPEVIQTSNMDCGPAALKCLLEGFGVNAHYGRLRDACQTDVDGTSIDTLEEIAVQLGLDAEQLVVPADHLLLDDIHYLPALVVVRLPNGNTHFVVAWRRHGNLVQVMDPASGRRWLGARRFLNELYTHTMEVPAADWREWAGGEEFVTPLRERMRKLKIPPDLEQELCPRALADEHWQPLAFLDAAVRMLASLTGSGALKRGREAGQLLDGLVRQFAEDSTRAVQLVPENYWCVRPQTPPGEQAAENEDSEPTLAFRGAVLVRVKGHLGRERAQAESEDLRKALDEKPLRPLHQLWQLLRDDGLLAPAVVALTMLASVLGLMAEVLLFRGLIDIHGELATAPQRLAAIGLALAFTLTLLLVQYPAARVQLVLGRHLESRFRMRLLEKLPRIPDHFFHSRPVSDTGERSHRVFALRDLPVLGGSILHKTFSLAATAAGIIWLAPFAAPLVLLMTAVQVAIPLVFQPALRDRDMRVQTHAGALGRFYMDALQGMVPIRTHGAETAVRREHEQLLAEWARAGRSFLRFQLSGQAVQLLVNTVLSAVLVLGCVSTGGAGPYLLLLVYWILALPPLGEEVAALMREYPRQRNTLLRALEPLQAAGEEEPEADKGDGEGTKEERWDGPAEIRFHKASARAAGQLILQDVDLHIAPGEHLAVVGESGAGKSSLVGLLLGWHRTAGGRVLVNGGELRGERLAQFRRHCAWVDPAVQLWNRSLLDNLRYGGDGTAPLYPVLRQADLLELVANLPEGLQSGLGESGALVSGGEGQRVRLGRALGRGNPCCAILDEPFRGLDRHQRRRLLGNVRRFWQHSTLICITHDIAETQHFSRVLVVADGRIVEDGPPAELAAREDSRYARLLAAEQQMWRSCWESGDWRQLRMENGRLEETAPAPAAPREEIHHGD